MTDTIAAIATSPGIGSISIIRVSGENAIKISNKIFKGKDLNEVDSHTINYGFIMDNNEKIDEVLVSVMRAPKSYTTEDVVEINCHGGIASVNKILELLLINGCRLAEPGEFTKRAFLNGRIDLLEADGIMSLISAKTETSRKLSINQLTGNVSSLIEDLRKDLVKIITNIEVNIDYPEYDDVEVITHEKVLPEIQSIINKMKKILNESNSGKIIKEGIDTALIGRPNVGKSSILNCLLEYDKAIVTDIAGTTRDIVEGSIIIDGVLLNIIDTAGIRDTKDKVEKIGVQKSLDLINKVELIIYVVNNNEKLTQEDKNIIEKIKDKNHIVVINKVDLQEKINKKEINSNNIVQISTVTKEGIVELKNKIKEMFNLNKLKTSDLTYLSSARSISALKESLKKLEEAKESIEKGIPLDIVEIDIKGVWNLLGEITGTAYKEEFIEELFSRFCLGK